MLLFLARTAPICRHDNVLSGRAKWWWQQMYIPDIILFVLTYNNEGFISDRTSHLPKRCSSPQINHHLPVGHGFRASILDLLILFWIIDFTGQYHRRTVSVTTLVLVLSLLFCCCCWCYFLWTQWDDVLIEVAVRRRASAPWSNGVSRRHRRLCSSGETSRKQREIDSRNLRLSLQIRFDCPSSIFTPRLREMPFTWTYFPVTEP